MTIKHEGNFGHLAANPRFLDRMNAVCSVGLVFVLLALCFIALQSSSYRAPMNGVVDVPIRGVNHLEQVESAAPLGPAAPSQQS